MNVVQEDERFHLKKQVKGSHYKKFLLIFIFTIFDYFAGMLALMAIEYQISYNKWKNSYSGSLVTDSEEKILYLQVMEIRMDLNHQNKNTLLQVLVRRIMIIKICFFKDGNQDDLRIII